MFFTRVFESIVNGIKEKDVRYVDCSGGTRSGKTYSILQFLILKAYYGEEINIFSVVSETLPHLKRGAIRDFKNILDTEHLFDSGEWNKTENIYTFPNGSIIEFFSADQSSKIHGPARDVLFINEAVNISYEIARQLFVRTRKLIICDYNPTHAFWIHEHIQPRENCFSIQSTYKDNNFLTKEQIEEIESNKTDVNWWRVYGEGKVGILEGTVYDFEMIDNMPDPYGLKEIRGMDFGFTHDPTALVHILADTGKKILYVDEEIYQTRLLNSDIVNIMKNLNISTLCPIYADCAEPKSISEIGNAGFNIKPCNKDAPTKSDKIKFQISFIKGWKMYVTKNSLNLIKELRNYTWDRDKDGNQLNQPIDKFNHALDALRYAVYSHLAEKAGFGDYKISFRR